MAIADDVGTAVGYFNCESGTLRVTDPCYQPGTWCAGVITDCRTGIWKAVIHRGRFGMWGVRVSKLTVTHSDGGAGDAIAADFEAGVDSGQAGVFDDLHYGDVCDADYDKWCELSNPAGTRGDGAVASSGFGDGVYDCTYRRDADGKCFEISIVFIDEEEE